MKKEAEYEDIFKADNGMASILDIIGCIIAFIVIIVGVINGVRSKSILVALAYYMNYAGILIVIFALKEIIMILHDIRRKVFEKK